MTVIKTKNSPFLFLIRRFIAFWVKKGNKGWRVRYRVTASLFA